MEEGYKEALIEAVLANRQIVKLPYGSQTTAGAVSQITSDSRIDDNLITNLNTLINKDISDIQFIAQIITTLEVYDAMNNNENDTSLDSFYADNVQVVEDSLSALENFIPGEAEFANQYNSYSFSGARYKYTLPVDFVQSINSGIDLATGISPINSEESTTYRNFLKEQVNEFVDETGKAAVIAKPKGGSGFLFYTSPAIQETFASRGTDNIALQYTLPRLKLFGANDAEVYYYPEFTQPKDANTYEPKPGSFVSLKDNVDESGVATNVATGNTYYMTYTINPVTGQFENFKQEFLSAEKAETLVGQNTPPIELTGTTEAERTESFNQYKQQLLFEDIEDTDVFGSLPADHFIFKNIEAEVQEPTVEGFAKDTKEQFTISDYGVDNLYGGFDHIAGDPAQGKINWISLPPDEQQAIQLQLMQAGMLSPDAYYSEAGSWGLQTRAAMKEAMTEANYKLEKIGPYLQGAIEDYKNRPIIYPLVYPSAGPLAVKEAVQTAISAAGGRTNMTTGEMAAFMDFYKDSEQDYANAAVEYERNLDLVRRRMMPESRLEVPDSPGVRTAERIEQTLQPEIQAQARADEEARNLSYLTYSVDRMSDIIG